MTMRSSLSVRTTRSNATKEALTGYKAFNTTCMSKSLNALAGSVPNKRNRTLEHILGKTKSPIGCIGLKAQRNSLCMASASRQQRRGRTPRGLYGKIITCPQRRDSSRLQWLMFAASHQGIGHWKAPRLNTA